jgi:hypothetical protein
MRPQTKVCSYPREGDYRGGVGCHYKDLRKEETNDKLLNGVRRIQSTIYRTAWQAALEEELTSLTSCLSILTSCSNSSNSWPLNLDRIEQPPRAVIRYLLPTLEQLYKLLSRINQSDRLYPSISSKKQSIHRLKRLSIIRPSNYLISIRFSRIFRSFFPTTHPIYRVFILYSRSVVPDYTS